MRVRSASNAGCRGPNPGESRVSKQIRIDPQMGVPFFYLIVWITPLFIAGLAQVRLREDLSPTRRFCLWFAYTVWGASWLILWSMITRRTREWSLVEWVFQVGLWLTPILGAAWMGWSERSRRRGHGRRGFEVISSKGTRYGEDRNSGREDL